VVTPEGLNEPQAEAVAHVAGPLVVFAGAGSGKTRVITYRIANLVAQHGVAPWRILAVTFTNKAAAEMRSRVEKLVGAELGREVWVGTFHATCARVLRRWGSAVDVPQSFVIYDTQDQRTLVNRILKELQLDDKRYPARAMLGRIGKEKQELRGPGSMNTASYDDEIAAKVFARYQEHLKAAGAVDFDDLIVKTVELLQGESADAKQLRRRFEHVLVDEFQDTNFAQYTLLRLLSSERQNLFVVGDDDQSIYRWRGADIRNIRSFTADFPGARMVKLEQNYRSTGAIVRAALGVIEPSLGRVPKELWTANDPGDPIEVISVRDERDEATIALRIVRESREAGHDLREIAIFYRVNAQSRVLEEALRAERIPYQVVGGAKFYERAEVKDALAYARAIVNSRSDVDVLRIVNVPARGIGQTTMDRVVAGADEQRISVWDALSDDAALAALAPAARKRIAAFVQVMLGLRKETEQMAPSDALEHILGRVGYVDMLKQDGSVEAEGRLENLRELVGSARDFEGQDAQPTLALFLERVSLQSDTDDLRDQGKVTLMTVHAAKGLEYDTVVMSGMEEDMFPYRSLDPSRDHDVEEERRLAYVAVTRARRRLVLTHASERQVFGSSRMGRPSRFINDIPADVRRHSQTEAMRVATRFVDRPPPSSGGFDRARAVAPWRHPTSAGGPPSSARPSSPPPSAEPGSRFVDREFFDDVPEGEAMPRVKRGMLVKHEVFGEGRVLAVEEASDPKVVAAFPGWGEKRVLLRFLRLA